MLLIGRPNAGKPSLIESITSATPEVADYPHATAKPLPAMMSFELDGTFIYTNRTMLLNYRDED